MGKLYYRVRIVLIIAVLICAGIACEKGDDAQLRHYTFTPIVLTATNTPTFIPSATATVTLTPTVTETPFSSGRMKP